MVAASCVVAVTSTPAVVVNEYDTLPASELESCSTVTSTSTITSTPTVVASDNGTLHASGLESCSASMDGQLPSPTPADFQFSGNVRRYYVAAEEVEWDYAPTGWDNWLGVRVKAQMLLDSLVLISPSRSLWKPHQEPTWPARTPSARNG
jgi:hypothetical protein